jgi:hypothetical protein
LNVVWTAESEVKRCEQAAHYLSATYLSASRSATDDTAVPMADVALAVGAGAIWKS